MFRNRLAWMFGCQVMNQSVENGSWPLLGDLPLTSLYRRSRRSYDRSVSDSSTCRRAPRWMRVTARLICLASVRMLLVRMFVLLLAFALWRLFVCRCQRTEGQAAS